jgi:uncharacterized protein YndB with AHSA1/START domain
MATRTEGTEPMTTENTSRLTVTLPSDLEIAMTRTFDAPRALVFKAFTDAELIPNWWGQRDSTTVVDKLDLRPGGEWRFVAHTPDGTEYGFHGEFREISPPERFTWTFEFEGMPGHVLVETMTFTEADGKTTYTSNSVFDSIEDRDGMLNAGMDEGAAESCDRLAELLATMVEAA